MEITSFNPLILSPNAEEVIETLESLGFERAHTKTGINGHVTSVSLKHGEGFHVSVASVTKFAQDTTVIRMNVRDFQEAYDFLISRGFKNAQGDKITETGSSKDTLMISPTGFAISLCEHIRK
jgi:hypothetical protein